MPYPAAPGRAKRRHGGSRARQTGKKTGSLRSPSGFGRDLLSRFLPYESIGHVVALYALGFVLLLHEGQLVVAESRVLGLDLVLVNPRRVFAEDHALDLAVRTAERSLPAVLLHDVVRYFQTAEGLDLPLRTAVPDRIRPPDHVVRAHLIDHLPDHRGRQTRAGHGNGCERRTKFGVDVLAAVLRGKFAHVGGPVDAAGLFELVERICRILEEVAHRPVVDDEVELRPVLRGLEHVVRGGMFPYAGPGRFV